MRVLICYPRCDIGGGANHAFTLAGGLRARGHDVFFLTNSGGIYENQFRELGIPVIPVPLDPLCPGLGILNIRALRTLIRTIDRYSIDVVNPFHYHAYFLALFAALRRDVPVVFTAIWFLGPRQFPAYPGRIVFNAEEFRDKARPILGKWPRELAVVPICIDTERFEPGIDHAEFAQRQGLPESGWKIAFVSRIEALKIRSLYYAMEAAKVLSSRGRPITLAIAGEGARFDEISEHAKRVNHELGRETVRLLGRIVDVRPFVSWADIVFGIGSCAVEGLACGKPTLIVGENGFAGVVAPETAGKLAQYNFAGRNLEAPVSPDLLADAVEHIMLDSRRYAELARFSRSYTMEWLDCRKVAECFEKVYENALRDPPLTRRERSRLLLTNLYHGYAVSCFDAWVFRLRKFLGRTS